MTLVYSEHSKSSHAAPQPVPPTPPSLRTHRSIVAIIPALNEAPAIGLVVEQARKQMKADRRPLFERVIVVDNGSSDQTGAIAEAAGAWVVREPRRGYGAACLRGLREVGDADIVVFIDGDASMRIEEVKNLIRAIDGGVAMAVGVRIKGRNRGMTFPQRFGNDLACALIRLLWRVPVNDLGPFRAITRDALQGIGMRDQAYGWTVEMQVRAIQLGMQVDEVSVTILPRIGHSKVSGTVRGVIGAGFGILMTIGRLWWSGTLARARNRDASGTR